MECISKYNSIYIHGKTNSGKTKKVINYLKENNYEFQYCSIQHIKNETQFFDLLKNQNIFNMLKQQKYMRAIVIDNIDYLQNNDKKIITIIIKYIKKINKLQCDIPNIKFIFIGINIHDKKVIELESQVDYIYNIDSQIQESEVDKNVKEICKELLENKNSDYFKICEKTIVSLVYHENIIYYIDNNLIFYQEFLESFVRGDYYDRISFQRQLWQFNEMTFFLKVINNYVKHHKTQLFIEPKDVKEIIFTKILTKYSNEYSNLNFVINICNRFNIQKRELIDNIKNKKYNGVLLDNEMKRLNKLLF